MLRLSKKSKWPIRIILASLKINNLQATENPKMLRFKVFRQPRYVLTDGRIVFRGESDELKSNSVLMGTLFGIS
ncbi:MAG: hypothetical protein A3K30_00725 [Deltaproteobacteria bacterium RBG_13_51_10]|nr:MAG: hypothetical protein A3K30_00725 [Deltaproteobacteria bacterium RBG_13_51_10]